MASVTVGQSGPHHTRRPLEALHRRWPRCIYRRRRTSVFLRSGDGDNILVGGLANDGLSGPDELAAGPPENAGARAGGELAVMGGS